FGGLSAPYWSAGARAAIVGMSAHTNRRHVIRAALESIAYQLRDVLDIMISRGDVKLSVIHADGGATRNQFLMQFIADITGLEIIASPIPDCSALGAAMAGAVGMGVHRSLDDLPPQTSGVIDYKPAMPPQRAAAQHDGWKRAVKQVLAGVE